MELHPDIAQHYGQGAERGRLETAWGKLEEARTHVLLERHLPPPPAAVLDVGGAEGAYALPLARQGYAVHLVDPVPRHVEVARAASQNQPEAPLSSVELGDARDLPAPSTSMDAALLFGPLYHLVTSEDRLGALAEAWRVLRPHGVLLVTAISRFASTLDGLHRGRFVDAGFEEMVRGDLRDGVHRNPHVERRPEWFTLAYFHRPEELRDELVVSGFTDVEVLPVEGVGAWADLSHELDDPTGRAAVLQAIARVEQEPSLIGSSPHLLATGKKP